MTKRYRLILLLLVLAFLLSFGYWVTDGFGFVTGHFWFSSGCFLLVLMSLVDQPHFSKLSSVFVNAMTAGLSLVSVDANQRDALYWVLLSCACLLAISSYVLLWLRDKKLADEPALTRLASQVHRIVGRPEVVFSSLFFWGASVEFGVASREFNVLFLAWSVVLLLHSRPIAEALQELLTLDRVARDARVLGGIFGVQSNDTFLVKLGGLGNSNLKIEPFDFVEFKQSVDQERVRRGFILEVFTLDQEKWFKVLSNSQVEGLFSGSSDASLLALDTVYRFGEEASGDWMDRFVGVVTEDSRISKIRFVFNSKAEVREGQLLSAQVGGVDVFYQLVDGVTDLEFLERKNQGGLVVGEALQLGTWNVDKLQFEQFGWVPSVNSPVVLASDAELMDVLDTEYTVGYIPNTNFPVVIDKAVAFSHHLAVVGVTGTGKSVFSRNLIRQFLVDPEAKVICVDFTGEYNGKFQDLRPQSIVEEGVSKQLFEDIDYIEKAISNNYNKDTDGSLAKKKEVAKKLKEEIEKFLEGDSQLSVFELPHVENTTGAMMYTKMFFSCLFFLAKACDGLEKKLCLVLEEAHTVVPERNFSGIPDKASQPLLNSIAQIALQGRKYNIGLLVIAQRTANVSKTILTQCNSVVAFQSFDKTSVDFLANYFGQDAAASLPKLKFRQAIAAGKAFKSNVPMIFQVPEITEP